MLPLRTAEATTGSARLASTPPRPAGAAGSEARWTSQAAMTMIASTTMAAIGTAARSRARVFSCVSGAPGRFDDVSFMSGGQWGFASHQNGRDADVVFFWTDRAGAPVFSERMTRFDGRGRGRVEGRLVRFDAPRNWKLL